MIRRITQSHEPEAMVQDAHTRNIDSRYWIELRNGEVTVLNRTIFTLVAW